MIEITGFDNLARQLDDAQQALSSLDDQLGVVNFDPHDPASIEAAIQQLEAIIDGRLAEYASNPIISALIEEIKEKYRAGIIERASEARLESDEDR